MDESVMRGGTGEAGTKRTRLTGDGEMAGVTAMEAPAAAKRGEEERRAGRQHEGRQAAWRAQQTLADAQGQSREQQRHAQGRWNASESQISHDSYRPGPLRFAPQATGGAFRALQDKGEVALIRRKKFTSAMAKELNSLALAHSPLPSLARADQHQ